jgi:hypothetical protein
LAFTKETDHGSLLLKIYGRSVEVPTDHIDIFYGFRHVLMNSLFVFHFLFNPAIRMGGVAILRQGCLGQAGGRIDIQHPQTCGISRLRTPEPMLRNSFIAEADRSKNRDDPANMTRMQEKTVSKCSKPS